MRKTTLYLSPELKEAVEREARRRGVAEAEVMREAIAAAVSRPAPRPGIFTSQEPLAGRIDELLALFNRTEPEHEAVRDAVAGLAGPLVVSPYVVAELDHLVATRVGVEAELAVLLELAGGAYDLAHLDASDLERASAVIARYADQGIGVADASIVVLADRGRTREVLTLDRRRFEVLRPLSGGRFRLVP